MSDTPRTDANAGFVLDSTPVHCQSFEPTSDGSYVRVEFVRELERENARLRSELEAKMEDGYSPRLPNHHDD